MYNNNFALRIKRSSKNCNDFKEPDRNHQSTVNLTKKLNRISSTGKCNQSISTAHLSTKRRPSKRVNKDSRKCKECIYTKEQCGCPKHRILIHR
jgi:hypothetical protein